MLVKMASDRFQWEKKTTGNAVLKMKKIQQNMDVDQIRFRIIVFISEIKWLTLIIVGWSYLPEYFQKYLLPFL